MLKKLGLILIVIYFSQGILKSQTSQLADTMVYTLGFSTYLSHTDKYASGFDIYTDSEGYTYVSGNTRDKNFPATEGAYQTELKGSADAILETYVGKYELMPGFILTITKYDSQLKLKVTGQGETFIIPIAQNVFVIKEVDDAQLTFNKNEAGEIESMTLNQNGMDNICKILED